MAGVAAGMEWSGPAVVVKGAGWRPNEADRLRAWALVAAAQAGDRAAFGVLWERYVQAVHGVVRGWVRDAALAEDVTSETFVKALRKIEHARDRGVDVLAWLLWHARSVRLDQTDRACMRREVPCAEVYGDADLSSDYGNPEQVVLSRLDQQAITAAVRAAVAGLPTAQQREVVQLCLLGECSIREAAQVMGRCERTVGMLRSRARRDLAAALAPWAPPQRRRAVALSRARTMHARARRVVLPPQDVEVRTYVARRDQRSRSPFLGQLLWIDPDTRVRRSVSHACRDYDQAQSWIDQMLTQRQMVTQRLPVSLRAGEGW